jgi:hypothetical protein
MMAALAASHLHPLHVSLHVLVMSVGHPTLHYAAHILVSLHALGEHHSRLAFSSALLLLILLLVLLLLLLLQIVTAENQHDAYIGWP